MAVLSQTIPALPVRDTAAALEFYRDRLGFGVDHSDDGFAIVRRDSAVIHLWQAGDESWLTRTEPAAPTKRPVRSGAESFLAGTASCRVLVDSIDGVDELHAEFRAARALHPVSAAGTTDTEYGTREVNVLDLDGNLITFFAWSRS